jgi:hypothetical protein
VGLNQPIKWQDNEHHYLAPPPDAAEWEGIIVGISPNLIVRFTSKRDGGWTVDMAEDQSIEPGVNAPPVDRRAEVRAALLKAGKPVE